MRLPQIATGPVQSMGRENINLPAALADAKGKAALSRANPAAVIGEFLGKASQKIYGVAVDMRDIDRKQKLAQAQARLGTTIQRTAAALTQSHTVDLNQIPVPPSLEGELARYQTDDQGRRLAPTHEVAPALYQALAERAVQDAIDGEEDPWVRRQFASMSADVINKSGLDVYKFATKQKLGLIKAEFDANYQDAVNLGVAGESMAKQIAEDAFRSGAWTPDEYVKKTSQLGADIDYVETLGKIRTGTLSEVNQIADDAVTGQYRMDAKQRAAVLQQAQRRIDKLEAEREQAIEKAKEERGYNVYASWSRGEITADEAIGASRGATLEWQRRILVEARESAPSGRYSAAGAQVYQRMVNNLAWSENLDQDVDNVRAQILEARAQRLIGPDDAARLEREAERWRSAPFQTPEYRDTLTDMRAEIMSIVDVGGIGAMMENITGGQDQKAASLNRYMEAKNALREYIKRTGTASRPRQWWEENREHFSKDAWEERKIKEAGINIPRTEWGTWDVQKYYDDFKTRAQTGEITKEEFVTEYFRMMNVVNSLALPKPETGLRLGPPNALDLD